MKHSHLVMAGVVLALVLLLSTCGATLAASAPAHPGKATLSVEHEAMLDLVKAADATHVAARSGHWSAPATWRERRLPVPDAIVLIPAGVNVMLDRVEAARLRALRVEGALEFAPDRDTALRVETLLVTPVGALTIGTATRPIAAGRTARITFLDRGPLDPAHDPHRLGRGLLSHGAVEIHGAPVAPHAVLAQPAAAGSTRLVLAARPVNWKKGDRLLLPGVRAQRVEDEEVAILGIEGAEITVAPLAHDHTPPAADIPTCVAHLSRNVIFESENTSAADRFGHVMFMHAPSAHVAYAAFHHLGRTDKLKPIDDPRFDEQGRLSAGSGANPRGRYAVHFHRTGSEPGARAVRVLGCVVAHAPGWGFVNHSSHVEFDGNVAFDVAGAGFVTEAGDEIGAFRRNLAVRSRGSGEDEDARRRVQDFGHEGDGFWFQGGGVLVEDNIAAGHASSGFIFFTLGLEQEGLGRMRFAVGNLWDASWAARIDRVDHKDPAKIDDPATVPVISVPIRSFKRNTAYACGKGFTTRFLQPRAARSAYEDGLVWNCRLGVHVRYTNDFDLRNVRLVADPSDKGTHTAVFGTNEGEQHIRYQNLRVEGWPIGLAIPEAGHHVVEGGSFSDNARSIVISTPLQRGRRVELTGDIRFSAKKGESWDIDMAAQFSGLLQGADGYRDPNVLFASDITTFAGRQLYYAPQAADAVPFPRAQDPATLKRLGRIAGNLPGELIGLTTREMWDRYGLALAGAVAPRDAATVPRIRGLVGPPAAYRPELRPASIRTERGADYQLAWIAERGKERSADPAPLELRDGWNLITRPIGGERRSFLIFAGEVQARGKKSGKAGAKPAG